jgi:hypothetical protein
MELNHRLPPIKTLCKGARAIRVCTARAQLRDLMVNLIAMADSPLFVSEYFKTRSKYWNETAQSLQFVGEVGDALDLCEATSDLVVLSLTYMEALFASISLHNNLTLFDETQRDFGACAEMIESSDHCSIESLMELRAFFASAYVYANELAKSSSLWGPQSRSYYQDVQAFCQRIETWDIEESRFRDVILNRDFHKLVRCRNVPGTFPTLFSSKPEELESTSSFSICPMSEKAEGKLRVVVADDAGWEDAGGMLSTPDEKGDDVKLVPPPGIDISPAWDELNQLIGLRPVKVQLKRIVDQIALEIRDGVKVCPQSLHMMFAGNPGCGKTTVARLVASILRDLGVLKRGQVVEVNQARLVGQYVGMAEKHTQQAIEDAEDGVLFFDDAHHLLIHQHGSNLGQDIVHTLLAAMENRRDRLVVIFATYATKVDNFFKLDPGLSRRVPFLLEFQDYDDQELEEILVQQLNDIQLYCLEEGLAPFIARKIGVQRNFENFANARAVRNAIEAAIARFNQREAVRPQDQPLDRSPVSGKLVLRKRDFIFLRRQSVDGASPNVS